MTADNVSRMSRTALSAMGETSRSASAPCYLLAYFEEERLCVYAPDSLGAWVGRQLPEAEELRIEAELHRLRRSGDRVAVLEVCLFTGGERQYMRVLCVAA